MRNSEQPVFFHCRQKCGQPALSSSFDGPKPDDFTEDVWRRFSQLYASPADIELFPEGMAEGPVGGGILGPTFTCLIGTQFANLKKGDRYTVICKIHILGLHLQNFEDFKTQVVMTTFSVVVQIQSV